jgi:hypothetical protein
LKIESKDIDIESLLKGQTFFIPRFQRPYSWDDENLQDLWNDVIASKGEDYFIGSMVVFKQNKQEYGVVDGQQRLTTITIFICCIRDALHELGETDLALGLHQFVERKNSSYKDEYVLKTETSFPYFQEYIQKLGSPDLKAQELSEERTLKRAHTTLASKIQSILSAIDSDESIPEDEKNKCKVTKLEALRDSVFNLKVIFVTLENEDDAYLIFETLNTRGKDLSVTDLAKNHFSKNLKQKSDVDSTRLLWDEILDTIHNTSADITTDDFFYHFWASRYESVPLKKLFPAMKKSITASNAKDRLDEMVHDVALYRAIHEPDYLWTKPEREIADSLHALQLFKLSQPTPAVLSLVRAYKANVIRPRTLQRALAGIENFHFAFTAVTSSRSSGGISGMYSSFAKKLHTSNNANTAGIEINNLIEKLRDRRPDFDEFQVGFKQIGFTDSSPKQKRLVQYILRKFVMHHKYVTVGDLDSLTIEHLAAQSLIGTDEWAAATVGQLGNLLLLDTKTNSDIGNDPFEAKKEKIKQGGYTLPDFINEKSTWNAEAIQAHTDALALTAYNEVWKL